MDPPVSPIIGGGLKRRLGMSKENSPPVPVQRSRSSKQPKIGQFFSFPSPSSSAKSGCKFGKSGLASLASAEDKEKVGTYKNRGEDGQQETRRKELININSDHKVLQERALNSVKHLITVDHIVTKPRPNQPGKTCRHKKTKDELHYKCTICGKFWWRVYWQLQATWRRNMEKTLVYQFIHVVSAVTYQGLTQILSITFAPTMGKQ